MKLSIVKYDLWNALFMCPEEYKTEEIKELIKQMDRTMIGSYRVTIEVDEGVKEI